MQCRRRVILSLAVLGLTSCGGIPTQYMANGYRYQDDTPLSTPAPTRPWLDEADHLNLDHLADNTAAWQGAVYDLINPLPAILPPMGAPITLVGPQAPTPADVAFDYYLRQGLLSYGYTLNPTSDNKGMVLAYEAEPMSKKSVQKAALAKLGKTAIKKGSLEGIYYLTLDIKGAKDKTVNQQATIAVLPYEKREYSRWPGFANQPVQGKAYPGKAVYNP